MEKYFRGYRVTIHSSLLIDRGWRPEVSIQSIRLSAGPTASLPSVTGWWAPTEDAADEHGFELAKEWIVARNRES